MSRFDEVWSKSAAEQLSALPAVVRDQVEALVRDVCRDPLDARSDEVVGRDRTRIVVVRPVAVTYQVSDVGEFVYVVGVDWRG